MPTTRPLTNQTTIDLTIQESGSVEGLFDFSQANNLSITDDISTEADYVQPGVIDKTSVEVFKVYGKPASYIDPLSARPGGISYMQIGNDFKVS